MVPVPNGTAAAWASEVTQPELERSPCMVGIFPIVYYSVLLGLGLPVNVLTAVALSRLATRTKKSSYWYLLAVTTSDILTQVFIMGVPCVTIYFLPCSISLATNSVIICKLKRRRRSGGGRPRLSKTTALLLAVTTVFIVLWAPRTIVMICHLYVASVKRDWRMHLALDIANMVAMLNTTLNFFLYCFVSQTFRRTVGEVLRAHTQHGPRSGSSRFPPPALKPLVLRAGPAL
ncbi:PREDICTED: probable G-protein coupled receptor 142 [Apaloderma vittatum]|uniref:probable G-protein coupled receptor 142 n=1 Tax=Apaloderma vittatum TaxID=57397 RepID=UPI000521AEEC|nr:PREDICTED: probable G-protein coupled receptor 142 [Apaloderma vittatum]